MALSDYRPTMTEEGSYTGPFSTLPEWHAAGIGLGVGVLSVVLAVLAPALWPAAGLLYARIAYYAIAGKRLKLGQGPAIDLPRSVLGQIYDESWYYLIPSSLLELVALALWVRTTSPAWY